MRIMPAIRKTVRWFASGFRSYQRPQKPKSIASQVFANGARMTIFTRAQHAFAYANGDFVRFGPNSEVIEIKSHDGTKWKKETK